ncbi:hypothetical protein T484DRAFT_1971895 [Baffinella frigidus]|nr:hypothetical protein T484DRAFT_1971895 [Cryptophyta sp. CCMP2293]
MSEVPLHRRAERSPASCSRTEDPLRWRWRRPRVQINPADVSRKLSNGSTFGVSCRTAPWPRVRHRALTGVLGS